MSHYPSLLHPIHISAVIEPGEIHPEACQQIRIIHEHGVLDSWTWAKIPTAPTARLRKAVAYLIPVGDVERGLHVVTHFDWSHTMDPFGLTPESFGTTDDVVYRCREVVDIMTTKPLRQFLSDVFSTPEVFYNYWQTPLHHRGAPGGRALADVALAEAIRDTRAIPAGDRDLAIAFAMLRRIGDVWCLQDTWRGLDAQDLVALSQLDGPFDQLASEVPALATALRQLLLAQRAPIRDAQAQRIQALLTRVEASQALLGGSELNVQPHSSDEYDEVGGKNIIDFPRTPSRVRLSPPEHPW